MKMPAVLLCTATALILPTLTGCGGSSSSSTSAPTLTPRSVSTTLSNGLTGTLTEDRSTVSVGGTVNYTLTLTNSTAQPITYQPLISGTFFSNAPAYLAVTNSAGTLSFPTGPLPQLGGTGPSTTLAPGHSIIGTVAVGSSSLAGQGGYAAAGQYNATASFAILPGASGGMVTSATTSSLPVTVQ